MLLEEANGRTFQLHSLIKIEGVESFMKLVLVISPLLAVGACFCYYYREGVVKGGGVESLTEGDM